MTVRAERATKSKTLKNSVRVIAPNELSKKATRSVRVLPGPGTSGNGGVTG